jgi:hypothetical protein
LEIETSLQQRCTGEFAFWVEHAPSHLIHYAEPLVVGSVLWPSEVVLMQCLKGLSKNLYQEHIGLFAPGRNPAPGVMGAGMAFHLGVTVDLRAGQRPVELADHYQLAKVAGEQVLACTGRPALVPRLLSPQVDLPSQGRYLHRLYMMAALRLIVTNTPGIINISRHNRQARGDGHNISALIVDRSGQILACALNSALTKQHVPRGGQRDPDAGGGGAPIFGPGVHLHDNEALRHVRGDDRRALADGHSDFRAGRSESPGTGRARRRRASTRRP